MSEETTRGRAAVSGVAWRRRWRVPEKYRTKGTARPEGGGRSAGGDAPAPIRQWPLLLVLATTLVGLVVTLADFRIGLLIVGGALLTGAVLRAWLPAVGMLAVRSRFTDVVTYAVLGTAVVLLTLMAEPRPWLEVPFLSDILRFSVD
ncbi:DUF3017 domain-containing protein [Streptomyces triticirhizae]|uniref:DUF3017 domain-containing protein n=1 Tax=Streptomyces triticirhizae TaxID=2483353 RepID=A0A3M2L876_9ACTN|nr:DUF3017 domain-containing protein [Streptomyces triticirhizae]